MPTSKEEIGEWFDRGVGEKMDFMIVVCDTFDYEDYPAYTTKKDFAEEYAHYDGENMQRIMEVYDLHLPRDPQLAEARAFHMPDNWTKGKTIADKLKPSKSPITFLGFSKN